jgi:mono/diheme cytochrome c family protein
MMHIRQTLSLALGLTLASGIGTLQAQERRTAAKSAAKKPAAKTTVAAKPATPAKPAAVASTADGKQIYATTCVACHQVTGEGLPEVYPPLAGSEWVTGDESNLLRIILHGMTGPVEVQGESFQGVMPPWGGVLKDADIAAVASYIRGSWGNKAAPVTTASVVKVRAAHAGRAAQWTAPELQKLVGK